jgi:hypothetical protein
MLRIGVIGPVPSVDQILEVSKEFQYEIEFVSFPYQEVREVKDLVKRHEEEVNGWFFSGPVPFMAAKKVLGDTANLVYSPFTGASLYKVLLQMSNRQQLDLPFSIDMINTEDVEESLHESGIALPPYYLKLFDENYNPQELVEFHVRLWKDGKTKNALTCLNSIYQALQNEGVPVYRMSITKMEIRQTMKILIEKVKSLYFKGSQIGVQIFEIDQVNQIAKKMTSRYHLKHMELKIKELLLLYCEEIDATLMDNGDGSYHIFSSRSAIERGFEALHHTVRQLSMEMQIPVAVGIGYGVTAFSAEIHARKAIRYAKERPEGGIVVVEDDGLIRESPRQQSELQFSSRTTDEELLEQLSKARISVKTYHKIKALVARMGWEGFTTADLASHLSMTVRNAQRIMGSLCEANLAECKGEDLGSARGRPSKIYKLK